MPEARKLSIPKSPSALASLALAVLFLVSVLNIVDRTILVILQVRMKADLRLSDAQLGALTGLAFALVYCVASFPIARLADRVVRTKLLGGALGVWSGLTAAAGLATSFAALVVCRLGVAVGEAACTSTSQSLIADHYPPAKRVKANAIWGLSVPVGVMLSYFLGGSFGQSLGWRKSLIIVGLAGLALAPVVWWLREPKRGGHDHEGAEVMPLSAVFGALWRTKSLRFLMIAVGLHAFVLHTVGAWSAPFYSRVFKLPLGQVGFYLAVVIGVSGMIGMTVGAVLASHLIKRDIRWYMWIPALAGILGMLVIAAQFLVDDLRLSLAFGFLGGILTNMWGPCTMTCAQSLSPPAMRAFTAASVQFASSVVGLGVGPMLIGHVSDQLILMGHVSDSLRYAVVASLLVGAAAVPAFLLVGAHLRDDLLGRDEAIEVGRLRAEAAANAVS